jgi:hypothetical protein
MPDVMPELRQKIEDLLELVNKKLQPDQFYGFAQTGVRYQSNASLGPGSQTVLASGGTLNNSFVAKPDWNWFGTLGVNYVHDFQTQTGETFEASVIAYDAQQFTLHQFDIGLVELRAGPRFALSPGDVNGVTVKPYVVATGAALADAAYMGGIGGGLTLHATVANISLDPYGEVVRQNFRNSAFYPLASGLSGTLSTAGLQASGPIAAGLGWQSRIAYARASDQFAFDSYKSFAADVWLPWLVSWPGLRPWTIVPTAGVPRRRDSRCRSPPNRSSITSNISQANSARTAAWRVSTASPSPASPAAPWGCPLAARRRRGCRPIPARTTPRRSSSSRRNTALCRFHRRR